MWLHEQTFLFEPKTRLHQGPLHLGVVTRGKPWRRRWQELFLLRDVQVGLLQGDFTGCSGEGWGQRCRDLGPGVEEDWGLLVVAVGGGQGVCGGPFSLSAAPASAAPRHGQGFGHFGLPLDTQLLNSVAPLDVIDIFEEVQV